MDTPMRHARIFICLLLMLSGCGAGSGGNGPVDLPPPDPRVARLDVYEAQNRRVLGDVAGGLPAMPITAAQNLPTTGQASFDGVATLRVEMDAQPLVLYGDAAFVMDFATADGTGVLGNFFGTTPQGRIADYTGDIAMTGRMSGPDLTLTYTGALQGGGNRLDLGGVMQGHLLGETATAFAAGDLQAKSTYNGLEFDTTLVVIGEITRAP